MHIFPAIDLFGGKAVRLFKGDYNQMTVYSDNPLNVARDFEQCGAQYLHVVDLEGAKSGGTPNIETIKNIIQNTNLFVEVGGGIRSMETAKAYIDAGVGRGAVEEVPALGLSDGGVELRPRTGNRGVGLHDEAFIRIEQLHENRQRADGILHEAAVLQTAQPLARNLARAVEGRRRGGEPVLRTRHAVRAVRRESRECVDASAAEIRAPHPVRPELRCHDDEKYTTFGKRGGGSSAFPAFRVPPRGHRRGPSPGRRPWTSS